MWFSINLDQRCVESQSLTKGYRSEESLQIDLKANPLTPETIEEAVQKVANDCGSVREQSKTPKKIR